MTTIATNAAMNAVKKHIDGSKLIWPTATLIAVAGVVATAVHVGDEFRHGLDEVTNAVKALTVQMSTMWSKTDHDNWSKLMKSMNPDLKFPEDR